MMGSWLASGARGYVMGESIWSKSRHEASDSLRRYVLGGNNADYALFQTQLSVPLGPGQLSGHSPEQRPPPRSFIG